MNPILTILQSELLDYEKIPMPPRFEAQTEQGRTAAWALATALAT